MISEKEAIEYVKAICRENLYYFYRDYIACDFRENLPAPHIHKLANTLMDLHDGTIQRLCVAMPPRHSKSSMVTLAYPLWLLAHDPNLNILVVSNSAGLSEKFGIQLREYVRKIGAEFNLYLSDVKHSSTYLMFTDHTGQLHNGSIRLVGASGSITGQDADYIILDDIYAGFDDITPTLLTKKIDWFKTIIEQRIEPHTKLVILHTRWHSGDLQGYLHEHYPNDYTFLEFPAINKDGTPLWKERYTIEDYMKKQEAMGERQFQAIYQQKPLDLTSNFFYMENIIWDTDYQEQYNIANCRSYDIAYTSEKEALSKNRNADYTAGVHAEKISDNYYIFSDFLYKRLGEENINYIQRNARFDGTVKPILIEPGPKGGAAKELFRLWDEDYLTEYNCIQSEPIGSKADRATPLRHAIFDGKIHIYCPDPAMRKILKTQLESFPLGNVHKDLIDAMSHAYNYLKDQTDGSIYQVGNAKNKGLR